MGNRVSLDKEVLKSVNILRSKGVTVTTKQPLYRQAEIEVFKYKKEHIQEKYAEFLYGRKHSTSRWVQFKNKNPKLFMKIKRKKKVIEVPSFTVIYHTNQCGIKALGRIDGLEKRGFNVILKT